MVNNLLLRGATSLKYYTQDVGASQAPIAQQTTPVGVVYAIDGLGKVVTVANVLVATVLIVAIYFDSNSATIAVLSGVGFFALSTSLTLLTLSGTLTHIITSGQEQKTIRRRDELPYRQQAVRVADPMQLPYVPPVALPLAPSYVAAVPPADERLKLSCYEFVNALFTDEGVPNPKRILGEKTKRPYQVQYSKPKAGVLEYLHGLNMIWLEEDGMLFFDAEKYPTRRDAINAIHRGG